MSDLIALDMAILLPAEVYDAAVDLSASLDPAESQGLRLSDLHVPHVTLTQQFVRKEAVDDLWARLTHAISLQEPFTVRVTGGSRGASSVWMAVERSPALVRLHERLMAVMSDFEQVRGEPEAFYGRNARPEDLQWVSRYRVEASFGAYQPHITLGHATAVPEVEPMEFEARTVAACHLGRFCTCRRTLRRWRLKRLGEDAD
ncbi:MAG: 2'-5' RNA ligase family protein [Vicinamibacterales bacterium]